jgi:transcriptional antiterminator RfaH
MLDFASDWNVIKTARFKEAYVQHQLEQSEGAEAYLPIVKIPKHSLRTGQSQFEPLFPGYLFVRLDVSAHLFTLRRLHAFHAVVSFDSKPAAVDASVIDELRRRERGRGYINLHIPKETFRPNQAIRIVEGAFAGQHGLFLRYLDSTQRVCILMDILKSGVRLELPLDAVTAAGERKAS